MSGSAPDRLELWEALTAAVDSIRDEVRSRLDDQRSLPFAWFRALVVLRRGGGRLRVQVLADALELPKSTLSRQIDGMEDRGLVEREFQDDDRRGVVVVLTSEGRAVLRSASGIYDRIIDRRFVKHLSETDATMLSRLVASIDPDHADRHGR